MMKYTITLIWYEKRLWGILLLHITSLLILMLGTSPLSAQELRQIRGTVVDQKKQAVESASVRVKDGNTGISTDINGAFSIQVPKNRNTLIISKIGYTTTEVNIGNKTELQIVLNSSNIDIDEIVVVGYGTQKKETVVGAVTQTSGKILERAGGVASVGAALTGNVPGVVTTASTGMPGEEDPVS